MVGQSATDVSVYEGTDLVCLHRAMLLESGQIFAMQSRSFVSWTPTYFVLFLEGLAVVRS